MTETARMTEVRTVFVFGDSQVNGIGANGRGWAQRLGEAFYEHNDSAPHGRTLIPAFYTLGVPLDRAPEIFDRVADDTRPRLEHRRLGRIATVLSVGFCDSVQTADANGRGRPYVPLEEFAVSVDALADRLLRLGTQRKPARLMYVGLTPCSLAVGEDFRGLGCTYTNDRLRLFEKEACDIVASKGGVVVPLMEQLLEERFHEMHVSDDGIHPNSVGHQRVADIVRPYFVDMVTAIQ